MKITVLDIDPNDERVEHEPLLRFSPEGGCNVAGCHCSDHPFLLVGGRTTAISVQLDPDDVRAMKEAHRHGGPIEIFGEED